MKTFDEYKRECKHTNIVHWKDCPECRELLVRSGIRSVIKDELKERLESLRLQKKEFKPGTGFIGLTEREAGFNEASDLNNTKLDQLMEEMGVI